MPISGYDAAKMCTAALDLIGESGISSSAFEDPKSDIEKTCVTQFFLVIGSLLSRHQWNFASPVRMLSVNADATDAQKQGYEYAHNLPSDILAGPFRVTASREKRDLIHDFLNSENFILSNSPVVFASYAALTDMARWPIYFIDLGVVALAARFSKPIADNTSMETEKRIQAFGAAEEDGRGGLFGQAVAIDARSNPARSIFGNGDPLSNTRH